MSRTFVVAGASTAGATAAFALREQGFDGRVVLIGDEPEPPYERPPLSKAYLRGDMTIEQMLLRPIDDYAAQGIELRLGERVTGLDVRERRVRVARGADVRYDALLIATGGRNRRLPVPGADLEGVHSLRTIADADRLRGELAPGRRALVVGMGFVGCEVAAALRGCGLEVVAIEPQPAPLAHVLGPEVGAALAEVHRRRGVELVLGELVAELHGRGRVQQVVTGAGRTVACDFAVAGVGMEPAADFLRGTPVAFDDGVLVDEHCRTGVPGVYAAGDVARLRGGRRVEHWRHALEEGADAAAAMLGRPRERTGVPWFWSDQYDVNLQLTGRPAPGDTLVFRGDPGTDCFSAFYVRDGAVTACLAVNRPRDVRQATRLISSARPVAPGLLADESADLKALLAA